MNGTVVLAVSSVGKFPDRTGSIANFSSLDHFRFSVYLLLYSHCCQSNNSAAALRCTSESWWWGNERLGTKPRDVCSNNLRGLFPRRVTLGNVLKLSFSAFDFILYGMISKVITYPREAHIISRKLEFWAGFIKVTSVKRL